MLDLAAPKVAVPATVFMAVMALEQTREYAALLVPLISWVIIKFILRLTLTRTDIVTMSVGAGLLGASPLPQTVARSVEIVLKGLVFLFMFSYLRIAFPNYY